VRVIARERLLQCAVQDYDLSVKAIELTPSNWMILNDILKLFAIFVLYDQAKSFKERDTQR
jgi:hypothetical protein